MESTLTFSVQQALTYFKSPVPFHEVEPDSGQFAIEKIKALLSGFDIKNEESSDQAQHSGCLGVPMGK
jgi:hypothetical protein